MIQRSEDMQLEFDDQRTSHIVQGLKRKRRCDLGEEILKRDAMFVVPRSQIQGAACIFEFFPHSIRPVRNIKKDIQLA